MSHVRVGFSKAPFFAPTAPRTRPNNGNNGGIQRPKRLNLPLDASRSLLGVHSPVERCLSWRHLRVSPWRRATSIGHENPCAQPIPVAMLAIEQTHGLSVEVVRHPGNRATGTWQDAHHPCGQRSLPRDSSCRPSAGLSSALIPGTSASAASWHTMTAQTGLLSPGSGWPKRVCSRLDWQHRSFRLHPLRQTRVILPVARS